jgi:hypothetical protein
VLRAASYPKDERVARLPTQSNEYFISRIVVAAGVPQALAGPTRAKAQRNKPHGGSAAVATTRSVKFI